VLHKDSLTQDLCSYVMLYTVNGFLNAVYVQYFDIYYMYCMKFGM